MDKWLKTGTLKRSASRIEIRTTDLAAVEITVDQQDDNHEMKRPTDWPVQLLKTGTLKRSAPRNEIRTTDLAAMDQQDDNHELQRTTDWPVQGYFCENEMDWAKCCGVCTDGGKSMSGCYKDLRGRIKIVVPHVTWSHCCIHRQSLAAKPLPDSLKEILNQSVKVVNFIKANSTNTRFFKSLCGNMGSLYTMLLLHIESVTDDEVKPDKSRQTNQA
ncbi:Zinc finger BED domain-containing protein 5 [Araneus ventricosus]|uniref:Zinc finger BED domain-containing protein 5 n=1 Tax=Araneus ventricosus TaxID=182803 RepID=A0A4Y2ETV2_ARAVE|nr:Zinc finger BED domain-containing protein 5 [Araneus ventricosus]